MLPILLAAPRGDVSGDCDRSSPTTCIVKVWTTADRNEDPGAVLANSLRLEVVDSLAERELPENLLDLAGPIRGRDAAERLPDHFVRREPEELLGAGVPGGYGAGAVHRNDRVV